MGAADFIVTGFPKCGTSALIRLLQRLDDTSITQLGSGLEAPFLTTDEGVHRLREQVAASNSKFNGHKYASYIFSTASLRRIAQEFPDALIVVCVRDVTRALVSWHNMHRKIASTGQPSSHFVNASNEARNFYSTCSLSEYYRAYAHNKLCYAKHLRRLIQVMDNPKLMVISQRMLAEDGDKVAREIADRIGTKYRPTSAGSEKPHVAFADKVTTVELDDDINAELQRYQADLDALKRELAGITLLW